MAGDLDGDWIPPGRQLPHSVEAEKAVLGAILIDNRAYARCAGLLPEHFALAEHRETYRLISALIDVGKLADPVTIRSQLNGCVPGDKAQFLLALADSGVTPINAGEYARLIRDLATRRAVIEACDEAISVAYSGGMGADQSVVVAGLQERISGLGAGAGDDRGAISFADIPDDLPTGAPIIGKWLCEQSICMIHADKSVGKSMFAVGLALAIARGESYWGWDGSEPRRVVYADYEMSASDTRDRAILLACGRENLPPNMMLLHHELTTLRNISAPEGRMDVTTRLKPGDVFILDNLMSAWDRSSQTGWDAEIKDWGPIQRWLLELRRKNISTVILHHDGKGGDQLGAHAKLIVLNTVIQLKRPADLSKDAGCHIELNFRYSRTARGKDVRPMLAELKDIGDGHAVWVWTPLSTSKEDGVIEMAKLGMSPKDIACELGIGLATVYRLMEANGIQPPKRGGYRKRENSDFSSY